MPILFEEIYTKAVALFDDPKITKAYKTNEVQFNKLMYTYLQNAIGLFTNPVSIGARLANYAEPAGVMETFTSDGENTTFAIDASIDLNKANCKYVFIENQIYVNATINKTARTITFPDIIPAGQQYAFEQYYSGEFLEDLDNLNSRTSKGNKLITEEVKDILARLLVKSWAEGERNLLLDIRNIMQDSDFKITGNDRVLKAKDQWVDQLDTEIAQLQSKLAWGIRFMNGSQKIGRG